MAEFCAAHADRFTAFASVALQFPELAAQQLEQGMKTMGFRGAAIGCSVAGLELSDPKFHPFFAKAEALGAVVFVHPQAAGTPPDFANRLKGNGYLSNVIWNPLETTIALSHLIFEGTLDAFPGLKICAAHGGGYLPVVHEPIRSRLRPFSDAMYSPASRRSTRPNISSRCTSTRLCSPLRRCGIWLLRSAPAQIVVGTDYPFPWVDDPIGHVLNTPGLDDAQREAILGGTATRLLGLPAPGSR